MKRNPYAISTLDYILSAVGTSCALIVGGHSIRNPLAGYVLVVLNVIGHFLAPKIRQPSKQLFTFNADAVWLGVTSLVCVFLAVPMNRLLPNDGYPEQLLQTGILSWVIALGALFAWRDSTLLFLAVPGIALFGLVGAYDTFQATPLLFFVFLASAGTLFSRSNIRHMLTLAERAGEPDVNKLRAYAWKSVAGPEWAFGSAVIVIILSALGAPLIQTTMQDVTSPFRISMRNAVAGTPANSNSDLSGAGYRVGQGPMGKPSDRPVLLLTAKNVEYLRSDAMYTFRGQRWRNPNFQFSAVPQARNGSFVTKNLIPELAEMNKAKSIPFILEPIDGGANSLIFPGVPEEFKSGVFRANLRSDGMVQVGFGLNSPGITAGFVRVPDLTKKPVRSVRPALWSDTFDEFRISSRSVEFLKNAIAGKMTDYEKAEAITEAVGKQITYNLQAGAVAENTDLVDSVLFDKKEGYCDLFATCTALLARAAGLHSRVAMGYLIDPQSMDDEDKFIIRDRHAHMWTEIYFEDFGWVPFDATSFSSEVPGNGVGESWREVEPLFSQERIEKIANVLLGLAGVVLVGALLKDTLARKIWKKVRVEGTEILARPYVDNVLFAIAQIERASDTRRNFPETPREYLLRLGATFPTVKIPPDYIDSIEGLLFAPPDADSADWLKSLDQTRSIVEQLRIALKNS